MPTPEELRSLLHTPSESLSVEYKSWLDLAQNPGKANLAKAAIALANEGGGIIVLGMREDTAEGAALRSQPMLGDDAFAGPSTHNGNHDLAGNDDKSMLMTSGGVRRKYKSAVKRRVRVASNGCVDLVLAVASKHIRP
jgi:hypothetical protein